MVTANVQFFKLLYNYLKIAFRTVISDCVIIIHNDNLIIQNQLKNYSKLPTISANQTGDVRMSHFGLSEKNIVVLEIEFH